MKKDTKAKHPKLFAALEAWKGFDDADADADFFAEAFADEAATDARNEAFEAAAEEQADARGVSDEDERDEFLQNAWESPTDSLSEWKEDAEAE